MGLINTIKNFFTRSRQNMTTDTRSLGSILDHPKIAVSQSEYDRIQENLKYYESNFPKVKYTNTDGVQKTRSFNHLPLARTACKKLASLVYNEQAEISLGESKANEFMTNVLKNDRFNKNFERYLESALALGGMAMRPYYDEGANTIRVSFVQAPVFFPLQSNTQDVSSAAIITKTVRAQGSNNIYYTLFEFHEWSGSEYVITNELYKSSEENTVGSRVPLEEVYEGLAEEVRPQNLTRPLFTYLKTPGMNNKDINSPLGLSVFDNAKTTIDFINTTYDEFHWELKMGQRRVAVPEQTLKPQFSEANGVELMAKTFDPDQNVFVTMSSGLDSSIGIKDLTSPIRSENYIHSINEGLKLYEMQLGVSSGMFTFNGKAMKTATEVVSENSDTYQLRNSIVSMVEQSIRELIISICELGTACGIYSGPIPKIDDITVNLDDGVFTDRNAELNYWIKALASNLVSRQYAMKKVLGLDDKQIQDMFSELDDEADGHISLVRGKDDINIYGN